jgi:PAS domain S-box-containing protein
VLVADFERGAVLEANPAACELFGYTQEEFTCVGARELHVEGEDVARVFAELEHRERAWHPNLRARRKDGSTFWAELRAKAFESSGNKHVVYIIRDVTHRMDREAELGRAYESLKHAQARLVHSGKLAAIGQIAGGVAHEVNNPATFILTNLRIMRDNVASLRRSVARLRRELVGTAVLPEATQAAVDAVLVAGEPETLLRETQEMVEDNLAGIERITSIVRDLRTFSRIEHHDVQELKVNELVDVACSLAFPDIRHRARLIKELTRLPPVSGEPGKLAQVFTHLLLHAALGIDEGAAGENEIRVSTRTDGRFVVVSVQDTGIPFSDAERKRLFEPFFSPARDHGSGLGLSLCSEIVRMHGGTIEVTSPAGAGTRFEVRLPVLRAESEPDEAEAPRAFSAPPPGRRARILVIDDDPAVLRAYRRLLHARHDVVLASGGAQGLEVLARDDAFDAVLCDVMMPEVDGPMVHEALLRRAPALADRLVFCSGGAFTPRAKEFLVSVKNPFLQKPIDASAIDAAVEAVRGRSSPGVTP